VPRHVRDARLETPTARAKLKVQDRPHYRAIAPGIALGYRRSTAGGRWCVRWYVGEQAYRLATLEGVADDHQVADGTLVLNYRQAQDAARRHVERALHAGGATGRYSVADAVADYVAFLRAERKTADDAEKRLAKHVLPLIGTKRVADLQQADVERVKRNMVRQDAEDPDVERRSRDSANRVLSSLKAALNRCFRDPAKGIVTDAAWRKVEPFRAVGRARQVHLDPAEARRLVNACRGRFRELVTAGLLTGARYGELVALRARDFRSDLRTLTVRDGKTGARDVVLTPEGVRFFDGRAAGRHSDDVLLTRDDGAPWGKNHHSRPMKEAVARAKLPAGTVFYSLRHSYASQALLAGMNMQLLAENLGTSVRMVELHYGKFLAASRRKLIEAHGPRLGLKHQRKVLPMVARGT